MFELNEEHILRMNQNAEEAFFQRANTFVKDTLIAVHNLDENDNDNQQTFTDSQSEALYEKLSHYHNNEQIEQFTRLGIKRGRGHRLISIGEILDYLWLMCWLGAYFDIDVHHRYLQEFINPTDDQLKKGITAHATHIASSYINVINTPRNAMIDRLKGMQLDLLEHSFAEQKNLAHPLTKNILTQAVKYYMPINRGIHDEEGILEAIYAQCQPQDLRFNSPHSHMAWFMLTLDKGYRFYDNPLYSGISQILRQAGTQEQEPEKIAAIIDLLTH